MLGYFSSASTRCRPRNRIQAGFPTEFHDLNRIATGYFNSNTECGWIIRITMEQWVQNYYLCNNKTKCIDIPFRPFCYLTFWDINLDTWIVNHLKNYFPLKISLNIFREDFLTYSLYIFLEIVCFESSISAIVYQNCVQKEFKEVKSSVSLEYKNDYFTFIK